MKKFKMRKIMWTIRNLFSGSLLVFLLLLSSKNQQINANENAHFMPALECYDSFGRPQKCLPEFVNAAYQVQIEATNTCGEHGEKEYCVQTGYSNRKSCDLCRPDDHHSRYLTDLHDPQNPTWWQSETMYEGIQHPNQVNLTLHLGKSFDITYIRVVFYSPRPESFAIYKRVTQNGPWTPYQYYSATCRDTYSLPDSLSVKHGEDESRALCTSEYSDISPLRDGNVAFSSLEGRPSAINFENSPALQNWVTATDIKITLDRLNTFGDEVFGDAHVLKSYFYAIADIAVGARCKCNGHASKCVTSTGLNGERTLVCECKHNTDGPDCEKCLPLYNDVEWRRATSKDVNECKPCNCNGYSDKCYFNRALFNATGHGGHCLDCRENRDGANCEKCKENFYMREDGYCKSCECHSVGSRSLQCNSEGRCQCKPGVTGDKCDRCEANYFQFGSHGCQPCGCDPRGSINNIPSCDPESGLCHCKENVEGRRCKECKPGFFNLDLENRFGCTPCFCYGHTSECQSAPGYSIVSITSNFNRNPERWQAMDIYGQKADLKYNQYSQSIGTFVQGNEYIYFLASDRFLGDQRASYNRLLKFKLHLVDQIRPNPSSSDIILEGSGTKISLPIFAQGNQLPDQQFREYSFRLHEHPEYQWQPSQSARGFMSILSNLTAVKIRASYSTQGEAILDDVELQTAHRGAAGRPATWIEQCTCPEGYLGQFCESCAPGFRHSPAKGGPFMPCIPCDCNKHADICDSETGKCICQHNTAGDTCDQCARGYYGNALGGTPFDCKKCPCPNDGACLQMPDDSIICLECPMGYFGAKCEQCSDGFYGDPNGMYGDVQVCKLCECNGNVDPNAVGNCNRTTGECLKCIYNTAGPNCDQCLSGHYGDPLALPHGQCDQCTCYPPGTEQTDNGISQCNAVTGDCRCKPNVIGRNCNECQPGYYNIVSGNGCENCHCNLTGSYNGTCDRFNGQCFCKPGVTGLRCDQCAPYHYGFSSEGCKPCDCDEIGSKGYQCDEFGQCPCNDNVEGRRCDRCKENKYNRHQGCIDCPSCYNLVQDAADEHRAKLRNLTLTLESIAQAREASDDEGFDEKLQEAKATIDRLLTDAKEGAGGGDQTLVESLNQLYSRLDNANATLLNSDILQNETESEIEKAKKNFTEADRTIQTIKKELSNALDLLQNYGAEALNQAREKFSEFGEQSEAISGISREARALADNLVSQAEFNLKTAKDANDAAAKAFDLARSAISQQRNISNELLTTVKFQMDQAKTNLDYTKKLAKSALQSANESYDTALSLFTEVGALQTPNIDINQLKRDSAVALDQALALEEKVNLTISTHESLLTDFGKQAELAEILIARGLIQKEADIHLLEEAKHAYEVAKNAVEKGDNTLREANSTYHRLTGFKSAVEKSSEKARLALQTVDGIENEINEAENMIRQAEDALRGAKENAEEARRNAQDAQKKYAEQASKDAENIRKKANDTKVIANKLRNEADQLNNRVTITDTNIDNREDQSRKDDAIIIDAKRKVGQAKADSTEAENHLDKALKEIKAIKDELNNLREININDLNTLENRLSIAETELNRANLSERLDKLKETKNIQNKWIEEYEREIEMLSSEVNNIQAIADSLPGGCFKRPRLEL